MCIYGVGGGVYAIKCFKPGITEYGFYGLPLPSISVTVAIVSDRPKKQDEPMIPFTQTYGGRAANGA